MEAKQPQLLMVQNDLSIIPDMSLPKGYTARHFRAGDENAWENIIKASFHYAPNFNADMKKDDPYLPERIWFICYDNQPVATASAWYRQSWSANTGYLHMVGILPSHSGRGLGLQVSVAALKHMAKDGRTKAVLHTDDFRLPAIKTYLKLGFKPEIIHANQIERWREIAAKLNQPFILDFKKV